MVFTNTAQAKKRQIPQVYMFGFSASFNDSTIYINDIEKKYVKMKRLYTKKKKKTAPHDIRYLDETMFRFQKIQLYFEEEEK